MPLGNICLEWRVGPTAPPRPEGNSLLNPLDFILMMEGTILFTVHLTRRLGIQGRSPCCRAVCSQQPGSRISQRRAGG